MREILRRFRYLIVISALLLIWVYFRSHMDSVSYFHALDNLLSLMIGNLWGLVSQPLVAVVIILGIYIFSAKDNVPMLLRGIRKITAGGISAELNYQQALVVGNQDDVDTGIPEEKATPNELDPRFIRFLLQYKDEGLPHSEFGTTLIDTIFPEYQNVVSWDSKSWFGIGYWMGVKDNSAIIKPVKRVKVNGQPIVSPDISGEVEKKLRNALAKSEGEKK